VECIEARVGRHGVARRDAAREEFAAIPTIDFDVGAAVAAQAYLRAGEVKKARAILQKEDGKSATLQTARFDVALAAADLRGAAGLVKISDTDHMAENAQRFALVAARSPAMLLTAPMLRSAGFLVLLLTLISVCFRFGSCSRALPRIDPSTQRSTGRATVRGNRPGAGLAGLLCVLCAPVLGAIAMEPQAVATCSVAPATCHPEPVPRMYWGTALGTRLPGCRRRRMGFSSSSGTAPHCAVRGVVLAHGILIAVGVAITLVNKHSAADTQTAQTRMNRFARRLEAWEQLRVSGPRCC
jgi:hypothetical protein